jgi:hypothetical protein
MKQGQEFPAVTVFRIDGKYYLADGFHRYSAAQRAGLPCIKAEIKDGDKRSAILHSVGANSNHGLRRTNEDKRRAVLMLLGDPEWRVWSDRDIARQCAVHHDLVGECRKSLAVSASDSSAVRTYRTKRGTTAKMDTARIGRKRHKQSVAATPPRQTTEECVTEPLDTGSSNALIDMVSQIRSLINRAETAGGIKALVKSLSSQQRRDCASMILLFLKSLNDWCRLLANEEVLTDQRIGIGVVKSSQRQEHPEGDEGDCEHFLIKPTLHDISTPSPHMHENSHVEIQPIHPLTSEPSFNCESNLPVWRQELSRNLKKIKKKREAEEANKSPVE